MSVQVRCCCQTEISNPGSARPPFSVWGEVHWQKRDTMTTSCCQASLVDTGNLVAWLSTCLQPWMKAARPAWETQVFTSLRNCLIINLSSTLVEVARPVTRLRMTIWSWWSSLISGFLDTDILTKVRMTKAWYPHRCSIMIPLLVDEENCCTSWSRPG